MEHKNHQLLVQTRCHITRPPPPYRLRSDDRVLVCDTRCAPAGTGGDGLEPPAVRQWCGVAAPPRSHAARALALALPAAEDPWLLAVAGDDGALWTADLRRPAAPLASLLCCHVGPVWRLTAYDGQILSCGEDGALRATTLQALRGMGGSTSLEHARAHATLMQAAHPLRCLSAGAGIAIAGDDCGRLHALALAPALRVAASACS